MTMHIISKLYSHGDVRYGVLIDGESYTINKYLLAALEDGVTVEELELEPDEDDDDIEPSRASRTRMMARSGAFGGR